MYNAREGGVPFSASMADSVAPTGAWQEKSATLAGLSVMRAPRFETRDTRAED
jgi:hypothetical protein